MQSLVSRAYGSMRMSEMCKHCLGNPTKFCGKYRCPLCKRCNKDFQELQHEANEIQYLRETWEKCKRFNQKTTGIARLDLVITILWGNPHNNGWRDYSGKNVVMDPFIVLRLMRV